MPWICIYVAERSHIFPVETAYLELSPTQRAELDMPYSDTNTQIWVRKMGTAFVREHWRQVCLRMGWRLGTREALLERTRYDWDWVPVYGLDRPEQDVQAWVRDRADEEQEEVRDGILIPVQG